MDAREILERRIDELCVENGRLLGQVARLTSRSIRTADKMYCLETENTKLRLLVRDIYTSAYYEYPSYFESKFAARMRELGIPEEA